MTPPRERKLKEAPLLVVENLSCPFPARRRWSSRRSQSIVAVDDVSFSMLEGETLGIIGERGAGKTTLAKCILRFLRCGSGQVLFRRGSQPFNLSAVRHRELLFLRPYLQMIVGSPQSSLPSWKTVGQLLFEPFRQQSDEPDEDRHSRVDEMLERVGLVPEHRRYYPHGLTLLERQRVAIARALISRPSLVILDEPLEGLDGWEAAHVIHLLKDLKRSLKLTYLLLTRDPVLAHYMSHRMAFMRDGRLGSLLGTEEFRANPPDEFAARLLEAVAIPDPNSPLTIAPADPGDWRQASPVRRPQPEERGGTALEEMLKNSLRT